MGVPAFWPDENLLFVANPTPPPDGNYTHGMIAFRVTPGCRLELAWQTDFRPQRQRHVSRRPSPTASSTTATEWATSSTRSTRARATASGRAIRPTSTGPVFAAPVVVNGTVLAGAWDGRLHAWKR